MKRVLVVGAGALGSWTSEILARSHKLSFTIVDYDKVEETNLRRQLYYPSDIGKYKAEVLANRLRTLGSEARAVVGRIEDVITSLNSFDLALALTDNIESRIVVEKKYRTLHAMVRPEVGMILLTTDRVKLANIMTTGRHVGHQEVDMVVTVASLAARVAKEYLEKGHSDLEGKLIIVSRYDVEILDLQYT